MRVFNAWIKRYANHSLSKSYEVNEKEKKRDYNQRVQEVEHGTFIPLVMPTTDGMGRECKKFYSRLSEMVSDERNQPYLVVAAWIQRKKYFRRLGVSASTSVEANLWVQAMNLSSVLWAMLLPLKWSAELATWFKWTIFLCFYFLFISFIYHFIIFIIIIYYLCLKRKCCNIITGSEM